MVLGSRRTAGRAFGGLVPAGQKNIRRESAAAWLFPVRSDDDLSDRSLSLLAAAS